MQRSVNAEQAGRNTVKKPNGKTLLRSISCDRHVLRAHNELTLAMRMSNHVQLAAIHAGYVIVGIEIH